MTAPRILVIGPSGAGKTTIARALARRRGLPFLEGDSFHSSAARARMAAGRPLGDAERGPWLDRMAVALGRARGGAVLACSALAPRYRDRLRRGVAGPLIVLGLDVPEAVLRARVAARHGHYMPPELVASQVALWRAPRAEPDAAVIRADRAPRAVLAEALRRLRQLERNA